MLFVNSMSDIWQIMTIKNKTFNDISKKLINMKKRNMDDNFLLKTSIY